MKSAFIYYSLDGNMDYIAKEVSNNSSVKLYRLIPEKEYPKGKISKYFWGGKSVTFGEKPKLKGDKIDLVQFDTLIIGSPVWAGTFAPPLNTFLHDYNISNKKIILVATHSGGGASKFFAKMKELLNGNEIMKTFDFIDPLKKHNDGTINQVEEIRKLII